MERLAQDKSVTDSNIAQTKVEPNEEYSENGNYCNTDAATNTERLSPLAHSAKLKEKPEPDESVNKIIES